MADDLLLPRPSAPTLHRGVVLRSVVEGEQAYARVLGARDEHEWGPCPWMPRGTATPQAGDTCLVAEDSRGGHWIPVWWPA